MGGEEPEVTGVEVAEASGNSCLMKASLLTATICSKLTCSASLFFSRKPDCRREGKSQSTCTCTCMCMCACTHSYVADGTSKVPDHEALVIAEVPVELQLRLAGQLREEREREG